MPHLLRLPGRAKRPSKRGQPVPSAAEPGVLDRLWSQLLHWYAHERRELPWRTTRDPYAILVSEVMLQQTQVERVVPKYTEFLDRFPTLQRLAESPVSDVIRVWGSLGYNRRGVRLHSLAREVMTCRDGKLPTEPGELAVLPGLGPYTSAAVACFAFDRQVPTIDTNVRRVLRRLFASQMDQQKPTPRTDLALATEVLPAGKAADWNQALMDLGATVCLARNPACWRCPVETLCQIRPHLAEPSARAVHLAAEARAAYRTEAPFTASSRFYRGRVVSYLRGLPNGGRVPVELLAGAIKDDFSADDQEWIEALLERLESDGLVRLYRSNGASAPIERVSLP